MSGHRPDPSGQDLAPGRPEPRPRRAGGGRTAGASFCFEKPAPRFCSRAQRGGVPVPLCDRRGRGSLGRVLSPPGPAGGAPDGHGQGRGAAGPGGSTSRTARGCSESLPKTRPSICPPRLRHRSRIGIGSAGGPGPVRNGLGWARTHRLTVTTETTQSKRTFTSTQVAYDSYTDSIQTVTQVAYSTGGRLLKRGGRCKAHPAPGPLGAHGGEGPRAGLSSPGHEGRPPRGSQPAASSGHRPAPGSSGK